MMNTWIVQNMFSFTIPLSTLLTTVAMLLPYWWSSETFQIGLWRARTHSSSWILVEPQIDTTEGLFKRRKKHNKQYETDFHCHMYFVHLGRLLFLLQMLSFLSVLFADIDGILWFITVIHHRRSSPSLLALVALLIMTILTYLSLSIMIFLVWQISQNYIHLVQISYSFYLVIIVLILHSLTLISTIINLVRYRSIHRSIQPYEKVLLAFNQSTVA
jgi:hypothetical protein